MILLIAPASAAVSLYWHDTGLPLAEVFHADPGDAEVAVVEHPWSDVDWQRLAQRKARGRP